MKRILVAIDLDPRSANVLARAIRLAATDGAAIRIVHAASDPEDVVAVQRRINVETRIMAEELTDLPLDISVRVETARPADAILRAADDFDADLIMIGAHGTPRLRDALFGTTGTHVVRHSERPILIIQNDAFEPYANVLAAIDKVETATEILEMARDVAPDCELFAVHAFYPSLGQTLSGQEELQSLTERQESELEGLLAQFGPEGASPRLTRRRHAIVETGEALSVIMDQTESLKPDLLAMGTRRSTGFLGSHAVDTLFWCPNDILVVPEHASAEAPMAAASA
jgi:nucleotide-binding universal stress UspA family protein